MTVASACAEAMDTPGLSRPTAIIQRACGILRRSFAIQKAMLSSHGTSENPFGITPRIGSRLAVHVDGLADHIRRTRHSLLPRVVADDDRSRFLLLDGVLEIFEPIRPAQQRFDADDRQRVHVDRHLGHAGRFGSGGQRHWGAETLEESKRLERLSVFEHRVDDLPARRLLVNAFLGVGCPQDGEAIGLGETQLVIRHTIHHAVHRGRGADAESQRQSSDDDHSRMTPPEPKGVAHVGQSNHEASLMLLHLDGRECPPFRRKIAEVTTLAKMTGQTAFVPRRNTYRLSSKAGHDAG